MSRIATETSSARGSDSKPNQMIRRSATALFRAAMLGAAGLAFTSLGWAANAGRLSVTLDVKPVDPPAPAASASYSVSVSRDGPNGLKSAVSYRLRFANTGGNTINQVVFNAFTVVNGSTEAAPYSAFVNNDSTSNPNCTQPTTPTPTTTSVSCAIGQLRAGATRDFFLIYQAPTTGDNIKFTGNIGYSEGNSSSAPPSSFTDKVENTMGLTTVLPGQVNKSVRTVLAPKGGTFYTGSNGQANAAGLFATQVVVPETTSLVTSNAIDQESKPSYTCSPDAPGYYCYGLFSRIEIRDARDEAKVHFNNISADKIVKIYLRQDAASITVKKPTPSETAIKIFYNPADADSDPNAVPVVGEEVLPCPAGGIPVNGKPCVFERKNFLKGKKGYYQFEIRTYENGRFSW